MRIISLTFSILSIIIWGNVYALPIPIKGNFAQHKCCINPDEGKIATTNSKKNYTPVKKLENTRKLYTYRLAMPVAKSYFHHHFNDDKNKVYAFWNEAERFLNEIYRRDLGIRFQLIRDDRLIINDESVMPYTMTPNAIVRTWGTITLNQLIGTDAYDIGFWLVRFSGYVNGVGKLGGVYKSLSKAGGVAKNKELSTIAHEIGHMFGANHTGVAGLVLSDNASLRIEPERGQSIMGYSGFSDFFSIHTIAEIFARLNQQPYYSDKEKTQLVDEHHRIKENITGEREKDFNIIYAETQNITAPQIDREKINALNFKVPKGTFISIPIPLKEKRDNIIYWGHQKTQDNTNFFTQKGHQVGRVNFQNVYSWAGGLEPGSTPTDKTGKFTITVAAAKVNTEYGIAPMYDTMDVEVDVVESGPFKIISGVGAYESAGKMITLRWNKAEAAFGKNSKVKITMSDDYGKTYKYVLEEETDNDGECVITLPYIEVPKKDVGYEYPAGACIIKVQVIGNIAYALTRFAPNRKGNNFQGGFVLSKKNNSVIFENLPKETVIVVKSEADIPENNNNVTARSSFGKKLPVIYEQTPIQELSNGQKMLKRIWKVQDPTINIPRFYSFVQYIYINPNKDKEDIIANQPKTFEIIQHQKGKGTIKIAGTDTFTQIIENTPLTITAEPTKGYQLKSLQINGKNISNNYTFKLTEETVVFAEFEKIQATLFQVTKSQMEHGDIKITGYDNLSQVPENTKLLLTAVPDSGYELKSLFINNEEVPNNYELIVKSNIEIKAVFKKLIPVTGIRLNETNKTLNQGETFTLTASVEPKNATNKNIVWSSSNDAVASVVDGVVTAKSGGKVNITVTTEDGNYSAVCEVTVIVPVTGIHLNETNKTLNQGETFTLTASVKPENAANKKVVWSSNNNAVATVIDGVVTAKSGGNATITATSEDGNYSAICEVTVVVPVTEIQLNETNKTLNQGESFTLIASVKPENATNQNIVWSSSNNAVATVINGVVTAKSDGKANITATTEDGNYSAVCEVTVIVPVTEIQLNEISKTLKFNETFRLIASIKPENATNKNIIWSSSNDAVATVINGVITAKSGGKADITVTTEDGNYSAVCEVTVIVSVTGIQLNETFKTLNQGETFTLTASIKPENATNTKVVWSSDNDAVATVIDGVVTAKSGGNATITATTEDGNFSAVCKVTVIVPITGIRLNETNKILNQGEEFTLIASIKPDNATNKEVIWSSSNDAIASVEDGIVTAKSGGKVNITATTEDGNYSAVCEVTVIVPVTGIYLNETNKTLIQGEIFTLIASIKPQNATNKNIVWSSSNDAIASVENGVVTAKLGGKANITATTEDGNYSAVCEITVIVPVTGIRLNETSKTLNQGETFTLTASIKPENATNTKVVWSSDNDAVATVIDGVVTAKSGGKANITAASEDGNYSAVCEVTVIVPVIGIRLNETSKTLNQGETFTLTASVEPENATNTKVVWSSSNDAVASVVDGVVTAKSGGKATITAAAEDGNYFAVCEVTIKQTVGITDIEPYDIIIYPTLVQNGFTIQINSRQRVLEIYSLTGVKVRTIQLTNQKQFVNVNNLRPGVYIVKLGGKAVKFVKQ